MKPKLILCIALVLSVGLFGCSTTNNSNGLTCEISVPSLKPDSNGMLPAAFVLKNESSQPIRICTLGNPLRGVGPCKRFDVTFMSGWYFSDEPRREEFYKNVTTLKPAESLQLPFEIIAGTNTTLNITAHFSSGTNFLPEDLDCWRGEIDAKPFTIKIERRNPNSPSASRSF
jgi:hypothetical protein